MTDRPKECHDVTEGIIHHPVSRASLLFIYFINRIKVIY